VFHYAHSGMFRDTYDQHYSSYWPASNERLEDRFPNNKPTKAEVHLIFVMKKSYKPDRKAINIPPIFETVTFHCFPNLKCGY
jgi:hypothetical protein